MDNSWSNPTHWKKRSILCAKQEDTTELHKEYKLDDIWNRCQENIAIPFASYLKNNINNTSRISSLYHMVTNTILQSQSPILIATDRGKTKSLDSDNTSSAVVLWILDI